MTKEDKDLLLRDLCARLPYGVKILYTGWDSDSGTDFDTVETLIGIDDRFIYTVWDKTGDREKHCLSVSNWKPYLRPMSSMTKEEKEELKDISANYIDEWENAKTPEEKWELGAKTSYISAEFYNSHHLDWNGLIDKGLAIAVTEENNPYKG